MTIYSHGRTCDVRFSATLLPIAAMLLASAAAVALALAVAAPAQAGGSSGGGGHGGISLGLGGLGGGHGGTSLNLGGGSGHGGMGMGTGAGHSAIGLGLGRGLGNTGNGGIHLGLSSHELGLGSNFGLDAPDNVLSRAARVGTPPIIPGMGRRADDRPSLQGLDFRMTRDAGETPKHAKPQLSGDNAKPLSAKQAKQLARHSAALKELELQELEQNEQSAPLPLPPTPVRPTTTTTTPPAPIVPDESPVVTTTLGSGEVSMIGAYFAQHGAPVSSVPTSSVNVSVGGTVPNSVALFPPPYDLVSQVADPNFLYFVWGQNVVIVDGQTNVVDAIIPDVLAHQA
jgi:hypothetical protein